MSNVKEVKINVMQLKKDGDLYWQLSHNGEFGGPQKYPVVQAQEKYATDFKIHIVNANGVTFSSDPLWIQKGTTKPTSMNYSEITDIKGQGTDTLTFHDKNIDKATLTYVLNFNGAQQLDPIIENGGGGPPGRQYDAYVIGGVLLFALLALLALRNRWAKSPTVKPIPNPPLAKPSIVDDENG